MTPTFDTMATMMQSLVPASSLLSWRQNKLPIGITAAIVCVYSVYHALTNPPRDLRHIEHASFFGYLWKSVFKKRSLHEVVTEVTLPVARKHDHGLYTCFDSNGWAVRVTRPEAARQLLFKTDIFPKSTLTGSRQASLLGRFAFGPNILFLNGDHWKAQRLVVNPAFHRSLPVDLFGQLTQELFQKMDTMLDSPIDFRHMAERWTLDVIGRAGFGFDFRAISQPRNEWVGRYASIVKGFVDTRFLLFPFIEKYLLSFFPERRKKHEELTTFQNMLQQIITNKRKSLLTAKNSNLNQSEKDLLTLMLEAGEEGNGVLTDEELMSNLCILFTAGHSTTTTALSYAAYYLAINPAIQRTARDEVIRVLGNQPVDIIPTADQLREMPYLNMVIKETLRINGPIASIVGRKAAQDTELSGVFIPKGTRVVCNLYEVHHNPTVWNDPEEFEPERFAPGGEADQLAKTGLAWIPFSNGARQCIGMNFSMTEQRVLLSMLLRKYEFELPKDSIHRQRVVSRGNVNIAPVHMKLSFSKIY
ncbi:cytochrome P-450 cyp509A1, partial [Fennellomyces sp. T-0311]